jgi:hypothetical protein
MRNGSTPITYLRIGPNYWTPISNNIHELLVRAGYAAEHTTNTNTLLEDYGLDYQVA